MRLPIAPSPSTVTDVRASCTPQTLPRQEQPWQTRAKRRPLAGVAAPPLIRSGRVDEQPVEHLAQQLRIDRDEIVDAHWVDNGPGWVAVLLGSADDVLALRSGIVDVGGSERRSAAPDASTSPETEPRSTYGVSTLTCIRGEVEL
jgi:hypothetical protein